MLIYCVQIALSQGDPAHFLLSDSQTHTGIIHDVKSDKDGNNFYQLRTPDNKVWHDKDGNTWIPQEKVLKPESK